MIRLLFVLTIVFLTSCSFESQVIDPDRIVTQKESKRAVSEVTQTLNVSYEELLSLIQATLAEKRIPIKRVDSSIGNVISYAVEVQDRVCSLTKKSSLPLNCEVVLKFKAQRYRSNASKLTLSYRESCDGLDNEDLKCPDSNAEKLMFSIIDSIKDSAGVID